MKVYVCPNVGHMPCTCHMLLTVFVTVSRMGACLQVPPGTSIRSDEFAFQPNKCTFVRTKYSSRRNIRPDEPIYGFAEHVHYIAATAIRKLSDLILVSQGLCDDGPLAAVSYTALAVHLLASLQMGRTS